jgi:hypothetical protein
MLVEPQASAIARRTACARSQQRAADSRATLPHMNASFGWTGARMALHYIERSDRCRQAMDAMHKLGKNDGVSWRAPISVLCAFR